MDWWCPERFDAPSVFARLLDRRKGGRFALGLPVRHGTETGYLPGTNVLGSTFTTSDTKVTMTSFMPHVQMDPDHGAPGRLVHLLETHQGTVDVTLVFEPKPDYARSACRLSEGREPGAMLAEPTGDRGQALGLSTTVDLRGKGEDGVARSTVRLEEGDRHAFVLDHDPMGEPDLVGDPLGYADTALEDTKEHWRGWLDRSTYEGAYREEVHRSLLTLKLLQHAPSGAFVAAPTTSLPERPGGDRNWDYRFAWLRDGYHIVMALESAGYRKEAERYRAWLARILRRDAPDDVKMLYRVDGGRDVAELALDHLEGYRRSSPVRVGNEAAKQHQLDTLGEIIVCLHRAPEVFDADDAHETWKATRRLVDWIAENWEKPDSGLWELRGDLHDYVYGKAMAWVGLDHGIQIAERYGFQAPLEEWRRERERVRSFLLEEGYDEAYESFTQTTDRSDADASNLLLPLLGILEADDERMRGTVDRVLEDLVIHGLCHRYMVDDRLRGTEGAFLVASFWLTEMLAAQGRREEAVRAFEHAASTAGPLGLLSEEADPISRELLGNHPQALSHLGLVLAAMRLEETS